MSISEFPNNFLASYFPIYKEPFDQNSSLTHYGIILESSNCSKKKKKKNGQEYRNQDTMGQFFQSTVTSQKP